MQNTFAKVNYKQPFTFASLQTLIHAFANCKHKLLLLQFLVFYIKKIKILLYGK